MLSAASLKLTIALVCLKYVQAIAVWGQCGGQGWTGSGTCDSGSTCTYSNPYYSQCLPSSGSTSPSGPSSTSTASGSTSTGTVGPSHSVGKLPALGWNTWNAYGTSINAQIILQNAQSMVSLGLLAAGYEYVNIDDAWSDVSGRDPNTQKLRPDSTRFPNGISDVATKVHALGLKLGIYSDEGTKTCAGYPGSLYYEALDVQTWASWGIDYIKIDNCNVPSNWTDASSYSDWFNSNSGKRYYRMTNALTTVTRDILFSICNWGNANVWTWGARVGHSWRLTGDANASWNFISSAISTAVAHAQYTGFYGHGDMDMMEIGNGALTIQEQRTHFAAWIFMKSPILLGTNLNNLSSAQLAIIKNAELLAFHQDATVSGGATPYSVSTSPPEYYSGQSSKGTHMFVINTQSSSASKTITFSAVPNLKSSSSYVVHDMWAGKDVGTFSGSYTFTLAAHDTGAFFVSPA